MGLEISIERLKELIFTQIEIMEQQRLICTIQKEYQEESARAKKDAEKHAALETENADLNAAYFKLQQAQIVKPPEYVSHNGVLWKITPNGFEPYPYCSECPKPTIMHLSRTTIPSVWKCSVPHIAPYSKKPDLPTIR
jgi:hypothetical protein